MSGFSEFELTILHFLGILGYIFVWTVISDYLLNRIRLFLAKLKNKNTIYVFCAKDETTSNIIGFMIPVLVFCAHVIMVLNNPILFDAKFRSLFIIYSFTGILLSFFFLIIFIIEDNREIKRLNTEIKRLKSNLEGNNG